MWRTPMAKLFEYKYVPVNVLGTGDKALNELGRQAWRVVSTQAHPENTKLSVVLMEREAK